MKRVVVVLAVLLAAGLAFGDSGGDIIEACGIKGGLVVHIGCRDGKLTAQLRVNDRFIVQGLDRDLGFVRRAREHIGSLGIYGRVSVRQFDGENLPYGDNMVNLVIAEDRGVMAIDEVMRVLCPGGVAYIKGAGRWRKTVKPWPEDMDEWTHHTHGPDGNAVANDRIVGPPKRFQWIADPKWMRAHDTDSSVSAMVTGGGRIFYMVDEAPISLPGDNGLPDNWFLVARDAFNGIVLWKIAVEDWGWRQWKDTWAKFRPDNWPINLHRRVVAAGDRVYATLGYRAAVSELDAATGKVLRTFDGTKGTREILHQGGQLILTIPAEDGLKIAVVDLETGEFAWQTEAKYAGTSQESQRLKIELDAALNTAANDEIVCLVDGKEVVCLDRKSGQVRWRKAPKSESATLWAGTLIVTGEVILYAEPKVLTAMSAKDGEELWSKEMSKFQGLWFSWKDVFVINDQVWTWSTEKKGNNPTAANAYNLKTGELEDSVSTGNVFNVDHHHRCYRNKATVRYIIASRRGAEYIDLEGGEHSVHNWVRGICHLGMMPANGLLYAPPSPCKCYFNERLTEFCALSGSPSGSDQPTKTDAGERLVRGEAYGKASGSRTGDRDWPAFRADSQRSGSTAGELPSSLALGWTSQLNGKLSAPVAVGGKVFVASVDSHTVHALDAAGGRPIWDFTAGGRVDSPPTYYRGTVLFGSADGWVTCLRASDGAMVWRFLAAPRERLIGAFGQVESAWPVHGSVAVHDGVVYFAAGRSSYLDGGIYLYGLVPATGKILYSTIVQSPQTDISQEGWFRETDYNEIGGPGFLADILQVSGDAICMRNKMFDRKLGAGAAAARVHALGGFMDDSYFQRAYWFYGDNMNVATYQAQAKPEITESQIKIGLSKLLVHDAESFYGIRMFDSMKLLNAVNYFVPGKKGYLLFATRIGEQTHTWSQRVPIRVTAMAVGSGRLAIAGPPDTVDPADPLGAFEGRKGGILRIVSTDSGEQLAERKLQAPPVFNGMAAAGGRLYISTMDARVECWQQR